MNNKNNITVNMSNINQEEDQLKMLLQESRRIKRKMKRKEKQIKKQKEREMKNLELKFGPRDTRVTIVSKEFASSLINERPPSNISSLEIKPDDFPILGQLFQNKLPNQRKENFTEEITNELQIIPQENSIKAKSLITIDIKDMICKSKKPTVAKNKNNIVKHYEGNILDSSQPKRERGKHKEGPKRIIPSKLKATILKEKEIKNLPEIEYNFNHSELFQIYCDNCITDELNNAVSVFLKEIVNFQEKLFKRDPIKGAAKRRYVIGFNQVKKYLKVNKLHLLIIAPNIKILMKNGILDNIIEELKALANLHDTNYVFALSRKVLGKLCLKVPASCIGILDYSGAEESFKKVSELIHETRETYRKMQPPVDSTKDVLVEELKDKLLQALK